MLRAVLGSLAVLAMCAGVSVADSKNEKATGQKGRHAMFVKADMVKNTVTFTAPDKTGETVEKTLPLAKDAKIFGEDNKPETFAAFAKNLQNEKDKSILIVPDQAGSYIVEIKDLPAGK